MSGDLSQTRKYGYLNDEPVEKDRGGFKHADFADLLMDAVETCKDPFNIGLFGKQGIGKSSILTMLADRIKKASDDKNKKNFRLVIVDAMQLSKTSLRPGIVEKINLELGEQIGTDSIANKLYNTTQKLETQNTNNVKFWKDSTKRKWLKYKLDKEKWPLIIILACSVVVGTIYGIEEFSPWRDIQTIILILQTALILYVPIILQRLDIEAKSTIQLIPALESANQFKNTYETIIERSIINLKINKVVVAIDNIDRCDSDTATELLTIAHTFMNQKNCINIYACDDDKLERMRNRIFYHGAIV